MRIDNLPFGTTDTLVRRRWKTQVVRSEGMAWAGPAY
jgi:hypothetical protein